jgi:uncharacterized protein YdhG (YjbR/CyaY superfamily)
MTTPHEAFLAEFGDQRKPLLVAMLAAINEACPELTETIKWNAPTFCHNGRDRMTVMLHKQGSVGLILHTGARPKEDKKAPHLYRDDTGLLAWNSNVRAIITFHDLADFSAQRTVFQQAVQRWLVETASL